jgi:hypothetical protein
VKQLTHYVFSAGACIYALSLLGLLSLSSALVSVWLSLSINYVIDVLGHTFRGTPSRTRLTHSIFTAPLWGGSVALTSIEVLSRVTSPSLLPSASLFWAGAGILIAMGHLFLDSMTQAGIYFWKERIALAHFRYNNIALNAGFIALGLLFLLLAVVPPGLVPQIAPIHLSLVAAPSRID